MATFTTIEPASSEIIDRSVVFRDVGWSGYSTLLELRGDRRYPRMVYLDGTVWFMSPAYPHEHIARRLGLFVTEVAFCLDIPFKATRSTTFRRRSRKGGVEGDETFYFTNAPRIFGKRDLDLTKVPPPDLAIEAVHTHQATASLEVYRRFGVPEVWVCNESKLIIRVLQSNGRYAKSLTSRVFPFLSAMEIFGWAARPVLGSENEWIKDLRQFVPEVLVPRVKG
jgi:Uma2 family endonuclease